MTFSQEVLNAVRPWRLLSHPFYTAWEHGEVPKEVLKTYARQYFHHVEAFPRYLSATHSRCGLPAARQELLRNLVDEELGEQNHPALWMQFATGLGNAQTDVHAEELLPATKNLIDTFLSACSSSYAEGVTALYMYEEQTPDIASTKMEGLKRHYGIEDAATLGYFALHKDLDVEHSAATAKLVDALPAAEQAAARAASERCARALWGFLDEMHRLM